METIYFAKKLLLRWRAMNENEIEKERTQLATGFLSKGNLYFNHKSKYIKEHSSYNKLGIGLMDFIWLDGDLLRNIFHIMWSRYVEMKINNVKNDIIAYTIIKLCERFFRINSYLFVYLIAAMDILMESRIDFRVFTYDFELDDDDDDGINIDDPDFNIKTAYADKEDIKTDVTEADKHDLMQFLVTCINQRQTIVEDTLDRILGDENTDSGQSAMKRLCSLQEDDEFFRKHWHSNFETRIDRVIESANVYNNLTVLYTIDDMMRYELVQIILRNVKYKRCQSCGKLFLPVRRKNALYCERIMLGQTRPCSEVGANIVFVEKRNANPVLKIHREAYNRMYKRAQGGYMEWSDFEDWKKCAIEKRELCHTGDLPLDEFLQWIDETSRQRKL